MRRDEFRDALRRAAEITGDRDFIVVGSQSVHGAFGQSFLPKESTYSMEVDLVALHDPDEQKMWLLAGRGTAYGIEIDSVDAKSSALPTGWVQRLIPYPFDDAPGAVMAWCLDPHDLVVAKALAGREKDWTFIHALVKAGLVDPREALRRMGQMDENCAVPRQSDVDAAIAFLRSFPQLVHEPYAPARRSPPKGRKPPSYRDVFPHIGR